MTDDAGFGVPSTFGGVIPTPCMDRIANAGLRYNCVFWLNSNKGTKGDMGICLTYCAQMDYGYVATANNRRNSSC